MTEADLIYSQLTVLLLVLVVIALIALLTWSFFSYKNAAKHRNRVDERFTDRHERILQSLEETFKARTSLSNCLIRAALGGGNAVDSKAEAESFLTFLVDKLQILFTEITRDECAVSIKLLSFSDDNDSAQIQTLMRDRFSTVSRDKIYDPREPFRPEEHTIIHRIIATDPFDAFYAVDDITREVPHYVNPHADASKLFNASAIHAICDPDDPKDIYGFLCVDNRHGWFDNQRVRYLMSIAATMIFSVFADLVALDTQKKQEEI